LAGGVFLLLSKSLTFKIAFNDVVSFKQIPEILLFSLIYRKIKNLLCTEKVNCQECHKKLRCNYYYLSGNDFKDYSKIPVILEVPVFPKYFFSKDDSLILKIKFLGRSVNLVELFIFSVLILGENGITSDKIKYMLEDYHIENLDSSSLIQREMIKGIELITPVNKIDFFSEQEKILFHFQDLEEVKIEYLSYNTQLVDFSYKNPAYIFDKKIKIKGKIGKIFFEKPIPNNSFWEILNITGMGNKHFLGGGRIKLIYN
jgi:hypothetical protein